MTTESPVLPAELSLGVPFSMSAPAHAVMPMVLPPSLPFVLNLSCPLPLPSKPPAGAAVTTPWPFTIAGPSSVPAEDLDAYITRRYYETLYLGDTLFPIAGFVKDLERTGASRNDALEPIAVARIRGLGEIETRYRRTLAPVVTAALAAVDGTNSVAEPATAAGLSDAERDVLSTAVELRVKCRAVAEGRSGVPVKAVLEEFERREVLTQLVLLLFHRGRFQPPPPPKKKEKKSKRKRKRGADADDEDTSPKSPLEDIDSSLELLADRIAVWLAVAELGIGPDGDDVDGKRKGKGKTVGETASTRLRRFWDTTLVPHFLPRETTFLSSFHLKVFGTPIPADLVPQKKPRKPKITHRLSVDEDAALRVGGGRGGGAESSTRMRRTTSSRAAAASPPPDDRRLKRSLSRISDHSESSATGAGRFSRSLSMDPGATAASRFSRSLSASLDPATGTARSRSSIVRAPSGKDLFKGREVGLLRRSSSLMRHNSSILAKESLAAAAAANDKEKQKEKDSGSGAAASLAGGLLGRRGTVEARRRRTEESQAASAAQSQAETLIFATPAKKPAGNPFGRRAGSYYAQAQGHPTPIREEEPSSAERDGYHSLSRPQSAASRVAETPMRRGAFVAETPLRGAAGGGPGTLLEGDSDDDLGELMVMTDDEASDGGGGGGGGGGGRRGSLALVPETPQR